MFTHHGTRTHTQNLRIASLLSFVAGAVNVVGFVAIGRLTTNVTGHFAFFMGDVRDQQWDDALIFFVFIFAFFGGAFVSNTLIELSHRYRHFNSYLLPVLLEFFIAGKCGFGRRTAAIVATRQHCDVAAVCHGTTKRDGDQNFESGGTHHPLNWPVYRPRHRNVAVVFLQKNRRTCTPTAQYSIACTHYQLLFYGGNCGRIAVL